MGWTNQQITALIIPSGGSQTPGSGTGVTGANTGDGTLPVELVNAGYSVGNIQYSPSILGTKYKYWFQAWGFNQPFDNLVRYATGLVYPSGAIDYWTADLETLTGLHNQHQSKILALQFDMEPYVSTSDGSTGASGGDFLVTSPDATSVAASVAAANLVGLNRTQANWYATTNTSYLTGTDANPHVTYDVWNSTSGTVNAVGGVNWNYQMDYRITYDRIVDVRLYLQPVSGRTTSAGQLNFAINAPVTIDVPSGHSTNVMGPAISHQATNSVCTAILTPTLIAFVGVPTGTNILQANFTYTTKKF